MPEISTHIKPITEQQIKGCVFVRSFCNLTDNDIRENRRKLHLAMLLSDNSDNNVKVVFNTDEGFKEVLTSIWGATDHYVLLKSGNRIPVDSVVHTTLQ